MKKKVEPPITDEQVAYHEAGHAVAAYLFGLPLQLVTVDPQNEPTLHEYYKGENVGGLCDIGDMWSDLPFEESWKRAESIIIMCFAGSSAERILGKRASAAPSMEDEMIACGMGSYIIGNHQKGDSWSIQRARTKVEIAYRELAQLRADKLIRENRRMVTVLTKALLKHKSLSAQQVSELLEKIKPKESEAI